MLEFMRKHRDKKRAAAREANNKHKQNRDAAEAAVEEDRLLMLNKPCTINNGETCFEDCVHFKPGHVWLLPDSYRVVWVKDYSKCRLWHQQQSIW